jgi:hypothetical protein
MASTFLLALSVDEVPAEMDEAPVSLGSRHDRSNIRHFWRQSRFLLISHLNEGEKKF